MADCNICEFSAITEQKFNLRIGMTCQKIKKSKNQNFDSVTDAKQKLIKNINLHKLQIKTQKDPLV